MMLQNFFIMMIVLIRSAVVTSFISVLVYLVQLLLLNDVLNQPSVCGVLFIFVQIFMYIKKTSCNIVHCPL